MLISYASLIITPQYQLIRLHIIGHFVIGGWLGIGGGSCIGGECFRLWVALVGCLLDLVVWGCSW
jgi:hypothetical protein